MSEPYGPAGWGPAEVAIDDSAPPPGRPGLPWGRLGIVAAVVVVVAVAVAVFSGGSGSDGTSAMSTTAAPATTAPRPVSTVATPSTLFAEELPPRDGDRSGDAGSRVLLSDPPPGYTASSASSAPWLDDTSAIGGGLQLFSAPGTTWASGPWAVVDATGIAAQFVGPPTPTEINSWPALAGNGIIGDRTVVVTTPELTFSVVTLGLAPEAAAAIAAAVTVGGSPGVPVVAVPASALPGLVRFPGDASWWLLNPDSAFVSASYVRADGATIRISTRGVLAGNDPLADAAYFLADVHFLDVGGAPAVAGRWVDAADELVWVRDEQLFDVTSIGASATDQLDAAAAAVVPGDAGFSDEAWDAAVNARGIEIDQATIQADVPVGDTQGTIWASQSNGWISWWLSSRDVTIYRSEPIVTSPVLRVAVQPLSPDRLGEGFTVVAMALGDATLQGATLRLRAGDDQTNASADAALHGIIDAVPFAGQWGAGTAVPWTTGGVAAELIAADGVTVLATATEADLS